MSEEFKPAIVRGHRLADMTRHELIALLNQLENEMPLDLTMVTEAQQEELEWIEEELEKRV